MAVSLSISTSQVSQSVTNNSTVLRVSIGYTWTGGSWDWNYSTKYVTINGSTYYFSNVKINPSRTSSGSGTLYTVDVTIPHNADGTKTVSIYTYVKTATESGAVEKSASATLTRIARTSPASLSKTSVTTGDSFIVYTNRYSPNFTHTVKVVLGSKSITKTGVGDSVEITIPRDWAAALPNAETGTATVTCETSGIGSVSKSITINVNTADIPTIAEVTATPHNENSVVSGWGIYLQGYSAIQIAFKSTKGVQGSTIKGYKIKHGTAEITTSPYRTPVINQGGEQKIYCYVQDSRGRWSAAKEVKVTVEGYTKPSLRGATAYRSTSAGIKDERAGTYITALAETVFASCNGKNSANLKCRYKKSTGSYGNYTAMTSGTKKTVGNGDVSITSSYIIELLIADALGNTHSAEFEIPTKKVALSFMDSIRGAAIGKIAEKEGILEIALDVELDKITVKNKSGLTVNGTNILNKLNKTANAIDEKVQSGGVTGEDGGHKMGLSWNGSKVIVGIDNNAAVKTLIDTSMAVDYIVEQGASGGWNYVKYNSGRAEAWRKTTSSNLGTSGTINGFYYRIYAIAIPQGLFTSIEDAHADCYWNSGTSWASARNVTPTSFEAIYFSNANGGAGTFFHRVTGRWK